MNENLSNAMKGNQNGVGHSEGKGVSKYKPEFVEIASIAMKSGYTVFELSQYLGVSEAAIRIWKEMHPEFKEAFTFAANAWDDRVEESLAHRAMGYTHESEQIFMNKEGQIVRAETTKHYPPDATAMRFWLMNRRGDKWKDRQEVETKGTMEIKIGKEFDNL